MIIREYVICSVCNAHHTLRIQLGYQPVQEHRFNCQVCNEPISFSFTIGEEDPEKKRSELTGAKKTTASKDTNFQYLSTDFAADDEQSRDPMYFGSMDLMDRITKSPQIQEYLQQLHMGSAPELSDRETALSFAGRKWEVLVRAWRLANNGKFHLSNKLIDEFCANESYEKGGLEDVLITFTERIFPLEKPLLQTVGDIQSKNPKEFNRLVKHYEYVWKSEFEKGRFEVFSLFFQNWATFSQFFVYVNFSIPLPKNAAATSINFDAVKSFYGYAQEFYSRQIILFTALNNIGDGRAFDQLNNITFQRYQESDNARRRENFASNPIFTKYSSEYDSGLRNAIFHNWISLSVNGKNLIYKTGGNGKINKISYAEYLFRCVLLFKQVCQISCIEYLLSESARLTAQDLLAPAGP